MSVFEYKGYLGSAEVDTEGFALVGKLLFIRDVITYSAPSAKELEGAFQEAVDDYLRTCEEFGDEPDVPCKGSFNVRIPPELHRDIAVLARSKGIKLNEYVYRALLASAQQDAHRPVEHVHQHNHSVTIVMDGIAGSDQRIAIGNRPPAGWEGTFATKH